MISLTGAVTTIVYLIIAGLIFWLFWWLLHKTNPPQPFLQVGEIILMILAVLVLVGILLSLVTNVPVFRP